MTKDEAIDALKDAIKEHLSKIVDNVLSTALDDGQITIAVGRYSRGLHNSRLFEDRAVVAIGKEFSTEGTG